MITQYDEPNADDTNVLVKLANASRFPLVRRLDAHWNLEKQLSNYDAEIRRVSSMNTSALAFLEYQERRLRELQSLLRSSCPSSTNSQQTTASILQRDDSEERVDTDDDNDDQNVSDTNAAVEEGACNQIILAPSEAPFIERIVDVPDAPRSLRVFEFGNDSFTLIWDNPDNDNAIIDYEIKYSSLDLNEGHDKEVSMSCCRWCLKIPIPKGRFIMENLSPNTEYHDIAIRRRNIVGWSGFSIHIQCLTTISTDENYLLRRSNFTKRISMLEQSIQRLEAKREQLPVQQASLARDMIHIQLKVVALNKEIERVASYDGSDLPSSHLLHGISQTFTKTALKRKLEMELTSCRENIALHRSDIIAIDKQIDPLSTKIVEQVDHLKDRKAALQDFDRRNIRHHVSEDPFDVKKYYLALWRGQCSDQLAIKKTLELFVRLCRRSVCAGAWRKLRRNGTTGQDVVDKNVYGIGGALLNLAEQNITTDSADATDLIGTLSHAKEQCLGLNKADMNQNALTERLPDKVKASLVKGDFLFGAGHFPSSLQNYEQALSMIESRKFFADNYTQDVVLLRAEVYGKIGHVEIRLGRKDNAIVHFDRQLSLAEGEDLNEQVIIALMGLGLCYLQKYDYNYAETLLKRALDLCLTIGNKTNELVVYSYLERCYKGLNRHSEVEMYAAKIEASRESEGNVVAHNEVKYALTKLDCMRMRLGTAAQEAIASQVVKLEVISSHRMYRCASFNASNVVRDDISGEFAKNDRDWVALSKGQDCYIHSLRTGHLMLVFTNNKDGAASTICALHCQGDFVYTGTMNGTFVAWHVLSSKLHFKTEKGHEAAITCISADSTKLVTGSADKCIIYWSTDGALLHRLNGHSRGIKALVCGSTRLVSASNDTIYVWDKQTVTNTQEVSRRLVLNEGHVTSLHSCEVEVIVGDNLGSISVWWIESGLELKKFKAHDGAVLSLQVDAVKVVSCGLDMTIVVSDVIKGQVLQTLRGHTARILAVAFDSKQIISLSSDGEAHYWFWGRQGSGDRQCSSRQSR